MLKARVTFRVMKLGRYVTVDDGGNYVTERSHKDKKIIIITPHNESLGRLWWKAFLNEILIPVGGKLILHCNFDASKLRIYLPSFYKQCLDAWSEANATSSYFSEGNSVSFPEKCSA